MNWVETDHGAGPLVHCFIEMDSLCGESRLSETKQGIPWFGNMEIPKCLKCTKMGKAASVSASYTADMDEMMVRNSKMEEKFGVSLRESMINRITSDGGNELSIESAVDFVKKSFDGVTPGSIILPMIMEKVAVIDSGHIKLLGRIRNV